MAAAKKKPAKPKKASAGSNSKYTPLLVSKAHEYLADCKKHGDEVPTIAGLARVLNTTRETLGRWGRDEAKPEWRDFLDALLAEQERQLLNRGLRGEGHAAINKLMLSKHGYHDKVVQEHTGADGGPIQSEVTKIERVIVDPK